MSVLARIIIAHVSMNNNSRDKKIKCPFSTSKWTSTSLQVDKSNRQLPITSGVYLRCNSAGNIMLAKLDFEKYLTKGLLLPVHIHTHTHTHIYTYILVVIRLFAVNMFYKIVQIHI